MTRSRFNQSAPFGFYLLVLFGFTFVSGILPLHARDKSPQQSYGMGLSISVPAPEQEVLRAVQDVVSDGMIQGSKEYNKDEYIAGAEAAVSSGVFPNWTSGGQVFYKERKNTLDPRNFKDTGDAGTLTVRYVVQVQDQSNTILKIDAVFVDDFHHRSHPSNGAVEAAEYAAIRERLATMHLQKQQSVDQEQEHQQQLASKELERKLQKEQQEQAVAQVPGESLEQHVQRLRHDVERVVKASGAQLKSAPFHSATSRKSLAPGSQIVILISTPYWFGVEAQDGEHGWIHRSQLEPLP